MITIHSTFDPTAIGTDVVLLNNNLTLSSLAGFGVWRSTRGTQGRSSGKYYWEMVAAGSFFNTFMGICNSSINLDDRLGIDGNSAGINQSGFPYGPGSGSPIQSFVSGDVIGFALDMDNGFLYASVNGVWTGDPVGGTGYSFSGITGTIYPAATTDDNSLQVTANFGATAFQYPTPSGYTSGIIRVQGVPLSSVPNYYSE